MVREGPSGHGVLPKFSAHYVILHYFKVKFFSETSYHPPLTSPPGDKQFSVSSQSLEILRLAQNDHYGLS